MREYSSTHFLRISQQLERSDWDKYKRLRLKSFEKEKEEGRVDKDIINLLEKINEKETFVTLSSCSGRIAVLDLEDFGKKLNSRFLGKWHEFAEFKDVLESAEKCKNQGWLIQFPPIIHVACRDLSSAEKMLLVANDAGFRRSGIISLRNLVVEIASLERLELPIAMKGKLIVGEDYLRTAVEIANLKLEKGKIKLKKLEEFISSL